MPPSQDHNLPRVAVLFSRIGPYHYARLKAAGVRLRVSAVEFSNVDATYAWDVVEGAESFERLSLFPEEEILGVPRRRIANRLGEVLEQLRPQVVAIPGWFDRCSLAALSWCCRHRVPAVLMSETTAWDEPRTGWKEWIKSRVVGLGSGALVGGQTNADYLEQLGFNGERICCGYDAVDNDYFSEKAGESRKQKVESRKQRGLPEKFFLASARFVEKKNLARLIQAYARYRKVAAKSEIGNQKSEIWNLVLLGDGPLKADLCHLIADLAVQHHVLLPGFKQYHELPGYYGLAGAFVHASTIEPWGLVVNEAMACGLPVLVSNRCGCAQDLVQEGVNGFTFDPLNVEQMAQLLLQVSAADFSRSEFGLASQRRIADWGTERFADGLSKAVEVALSSPAPRAGIFDRLLLRLLLMR